MESVKTEAEGRMSEAQFENSLAFAQAMDAADPLNHFREHFFIPKHGDGDAIYFTGNSLGLQPKSVADFIQQELDDWATLGVEGHLEAKNPWVAYHEAFAAPLAMLVGSQEDEVVAMNGLTTNLHLLLTTFYRPSKKRYKILCEAKAFPSDQYAIESQVKLHGLAPQAAMIELAPREGEHYLRTEDVVAAIQNAGDELALVLFGGVNYYSGEVMNMQAITAAAHGVGAYAGFDLAHAIGNVPMQLHQWGVDFACWCSYKYLNSGPGGVAGVFIHQQHAQNTGLPRLAGWWGSDKQSRFQMHREFVPIPTAEGWQLSNAPVLSMAAHKAALQIFEEAGMDALAEKSRQLTGYLFFVLDEIAGQSLQIITPRGAHGCQVSILVHHRGRKVFEALTAAGVVADWREPNVIRVAPVPLYNTFEDVWRFGQIIRSILQS